MDTKEEQSIINLLNAMAADIALMKVNVRETRTEVALIFAQVSHLAQITEDLAEEAHNEPSGEALDVAYDFLQKSPLAKHPMFKEMLGPLEDMIKKTKA